MLAFGALPVARKMGLAVPEAVAIVGFDDLEMARHIQPALTTLHVSAETLGHLVADRVAVALDQLPVPVATELEVELVVRESTCPTPADRPARWPAQVGRGRVENLGNSPLLAVQSIAAAGFGADSSSLPPAHPMTPRLRSPRALHDD